MLMRKMAPALGRLVVDPAPDARGFWTVRHADGSEHGDTDAQPVATFYDQNIADRMVHDHNGRLSGSAIIQELERTAMDIAQQICESADDTGCSDDLTVVDAAAVAAAVAFDKYRIREPLGDQEYTGLYADLSVKLLIVCRALRAVFNSADQAGCSEDLTVTRKSAVEHLATAAATASKIVDGKLTGMDGWKGVTLVCDVYDKSPYGDDETPSWGRIAVDVDLINRVMELRDTLPQVDGSDISTRYDIDWQGEPRTELERMTVTAYSNVWFSAELALTVMMMKSSISCFASRIHNRMTWCFVMTMRARRTRARRRTQRTRATQRKSARTRRVRANRPVI